MVENLETNKTDLKSYIQKTKTKVLDMAIRGELVPQNPNDEPASVLLERIKNEQQSAKSKKKNTVHNTHYDNDKLLVVNDEFPFEIPENWAWCRLGEVCEILDNLRIPINTDERTKRIEGKKQSELYPYYGATGLVGFIDDFIISGTYILLGEDGAPFLDKYDRKAYKVSGNIWVNNHAHILKPKIEIDYVLSLLNTIDYSNYVSGTTRLKLTQSDMKTISIPLPPLSEQKRIVQKIEEIFTELDTIEENLT